MATDLLIGALLFLPAQVLFSPHLLYGVLTKS